MHYLEAPSGIRWHYRLDGEGDRLLFLHGWGVDRSIWQQQEKHFIRTHRVLTLDLPGHGKTSWQKISLGEMAQDILFLLAYAGFDKISVVGSSFGGLLALKMMTLDPAKFRSLIFVGSQPKFARSADYPFGLESGRIRQLARQLDANYPSMVDIFFRSLFTKEERASRRFKWIQRFRRGGGYPRKDALLELLDVLRDEDLRGHLAALNVPVQFINGTQDYICPRDAFSYLKERVPQARVEWFEQCGHYPFISKPREFNRVLEDFLQQGMRKN